jgi:leucyl-tRNA synthetase
MVLMALKADRKLCNSLFKSSTCSMEPLHDPRREIYVIIDGPNVVREGETPASMQKLVAAIAYFLVLQETKSRIKCMAFVPNHWLNQKQSENSELTPEDQEILQALAHQGHVALVPSQSHDDYYILDYAMEKDGYIVTNDMFRDHISKKVCGPSVR